MKHTIDNTLTSEELNKELPLFAEMPATNMPKDHYNLIHAGEAALAVGIVFGVAYAGNKARDYFKKDIHIADPNNDIAWEYQDK